MDWPGEATGFTRRRLAHAPGMGGRRVRLSFAGHSVSVMSVLFHSPDRRASAPAATGSTVRVVKRMSPLGVVAGVSEESQQLHHVSVPPARLPVHPITPGAMAVKVWLGKQTASERFYQTFLWVISVTALSSVEGYKP